MARLTYRDAGVDIDAGDSLVERIRPSAAAGDDGLEALASAIDDLNFDRAAELCRQLLASTGA